MLAQVPMGLVIVELRPVKDDFTQQRAWLVEL